MEDRVYATGTRKRSVARVWIRPGTGKVVINSQDPLNYFQREDLVKQIIRPLETVGLVGQIDIKAKVSGGGISGQAGAVVFGLARALQKLKPELKPILKSAGHLTRDPREKERMKYGLAKRRKRFQFSKR